MVTSKTKTSEIPAWAAKFISADDCDQIEAAVRRAEKTTCGEIVPMLVQSSVQLSVPRRLLFISLLLVIVIGLNLLESHFDFYSILGICIELALCALAAAIAFLAPIPAFLVRLMLSKYDLQQLVEKQAELEFYRLGINGTERQSGVLMFVSLTEHRAVVLADKSIAEKLPTQTWNQVLTTLLSGIKQDQAVKGFVDAIDMSAAILAEHFPQHASDKDELANRLVIK